MQKSKKIQLISLVIFLITGILFFTAQVKAQDFFNTYQTIPTQGAFDWESFTIGADTYIAVANSYNDSTRNIDSKIYRWNGSSFVVVQSIRTNGALDWESFTIGTDTYLAVANCRNDSTRHIDSKIYRWNGSSFVVVQSIRTNGAHDWESFTIGTDTYLAVANHYTDSQQHNIDSKIYRWNGSSFVEAQSISTLGARDWESFTIGTDTYLAVANFRLGSVFTVDSKIYRWNGSSFVEVQSIPTHAAASWESFTIGTDTYLALASYSPESKIYRWDGNLFIEVQSIPTNGAYDWESFTIGTDTYLAVANGHDGSTYNIDSKIYRWDGNSFVEVQSIPTHCATDWESFTIGTDTYLAVANYNNDSICNIDSVIFKKKAPEADAGGDQIVYDSVTLDGSASYDADGGYIVSWEWSLIHQADPDNCSRIASGEIVDVDGLAKGFYTVTLTVTDNDGLSGTDDMILSAIGCKGDFDSDGDVDGSDLAAFASNFGRVDCPTCP